MTIHQEGFASYNGQSCRVTPSTPLLSMATRSQSTALVQAESVTGIFSTFAWISKVELERSVYRRTEGKSRNNDGFGFQEMMIVYVLKTFTRQGFCTTLGKSLRVVAFHLNTCDRG